MTMNVTFSPDAPDLDLNFWATPAGEYEGNCYSFAFDDPGPVGAPKAQPGDRARLAPVLGSSGLKCPVLASRVVRDNPSSVYLTDPSLPCGKGYYKVALIAAPGQDFHFLKETRNVVYVSKVKDTRAAIAQTYGVPIEKVRCNERVVPGDKVLIRDIKAWSHKRGFGGTALLTDAAGHPILDPRKANFDYQGLDYTKFCSMFCVKKGSKTR